MGPIAITGQSRVVQDDWQTGNLQETAFIDGKRLLGHAWSQTAFVRGKLSTESKRRNAGDRQFSFRKDSQQSWRAQDDSTD